ncbi:carbohydrate sulfotransferase 15-like [Babylonia areolata]|uniref:carbohydrate sulfotransferase 15-like n=1 Tax=Babylonia areolata TaxID=304850 RepID=UPI003FD5CD78
MDPGDGAWQLGHEPHHHVGSSCSVVVVRTCCPAALLDTASGLNGEWGVLVQSLSSEDRDDDVTDSLRSSRPGDAEKIRTFAETVLGYTAMPDQCKSKPGFTQPKTESKFDLFKSGPYQLLPDYRNPCWRLPGTQDLRCLPFFFLAGFPKCGTTDMYARIVRHPHVVDAGKEPHWFTKTRFRGDCSASTIWENSRWTTLPGNERCTEPRIITADYIRHLTPNAKIIVMLRNPSRRLYSDFLFFWARNKTPEYFHQLVEKNIATFNACVEKESLRTCAYNQSIFSIRLFIGVYSVFVEDWLLRFPRDQMLFIRLEDVQSGADTVPAVFRFLGLAAPNSTMESIVALGRRNVGRVSRSIGPMWNETRRLLDDFYRPFNARLAHILQDSRFTWEDV